MKNLRPLLFLAILGLALCTQSCFMFRKKNGCNTCPSFNGRKH